MERIIKDAKKLKADLFDLQIIDQQDDTHKILELKDMSDPDDLKTTLILLNSNIKSQLQSMKNFEVKALLLLTDQLQDLATVSSKDDNRLRYDLEKSIAVLKEQISKLETETANIKNSGLANNRLVKILVPIGGFMMFVLFLFTLNPDATKYAGELGKSLVHPFTQEESVNNEQHKER